MNEDKEFIQLIDVITYLMQKGSTGVWIQPDFFPKGDHWDQFRFQIHCVDTILGQVPSLNLNETEKKALNYAVIKAKEKFIDNQKMKILINVGYDMKDAYELIKKKRNGHQDNSEV